MADDDRVLKAIAELGKGLEQVEKGVAQLGNGLEEVRAELTATRVGIMDRIDRLQNHVDLIRDDVSVNFGRADRADRIALGVRDEVQAIATQVTAMHRQISRLQADVKELRRPNP